MGYEQARIPVDTAVRIVRDLYGIQGKAIPLPGEIDFNFHIQGVDGKAYVLKISRPGSSREATAFQDSLLGHLKSSGADWRFPVQVHDKNGMTVSEVRDPKGQIRQVRLLEWIPGRTWRQVNPKNPSLFCQLGAMMGKITKTLENFDHPGAHRIIEWDIAQGAWTRSHTQLFIGRKKELILQLQEAFAAQDAGYRNLRKGIVHNDANDYNVLVTLSPENPEVLAVLDYGDSVFTQVINDVAVACTYAVMGLKDPLPAAMAVVSGYHRIQPLEERELECLYGCIGMRLVISVVKSAINKKAEPENLYLSISEAPAWELVEKWTALSPEFVHFAFRNACGYPAHPKIKEFEQWARSHPFGLNELLDEAPTACIAPISLAPDSPWIRNIRTENGVFDLIVDLDSWRSAHPNEIPAGGYLEPRPIYGHPDFTLPGNDGPESRTVHLGLDVWLPEGTPVLAPFPGKVVLVANDDAPNGYGGLTILEHSWGNAAFYTLYGHLDPNVSQVLPLGGIVEKGDKIGVLGGDNVNGNWPPHLHFQILLSLLGHTKDFPGVARHREIGIWADLCPDPNLFLQCGALQRGPDLPKETLLAQRGRILGKGLSLNYDRPLHIVRGSGQFLLDRSARRYLDTVNNVAHVGHEHPAVVGAGQRQMAILNTNTRYLHENPIVLAQELLKTLPPELSVVYLVNSGSEANELALRMAKTATGSKEMIVSEMGYHGNSNACIEISSYKFDRRGGTGCPKHTHVLPLPDPFRGKYRGTHANLGYLDELRQILKKLEDTGKRPCALIMEPIISCAGQVVPPPGFFSAAYQMVKQAGGICISDEVQTGCGRVGNSFWGFQLHNVIPDIVTLGKPLGNGHPMAAVVCTATVAEAFDNGMEYFNTFGGNPVSCAIATAVLRTVAEEGLQENALTLGNFLITQLRGLASTHPVIADVRGSGLFLGVEFCDGEKRPLPKVTDYVVARMLQHGILMASDGPDRNVLKIKPPLVFDQRDAERLLAVLAKILKEDPITSIEMEI